MGFQVSVHVPGGKACAWPRVWGCAATMFSFATNPDHPPTSRRPKSTTGRKPSTMRKNWSTSL